MAWEHISHTSDPGSLSGTWHGDTGLKSYFSPVLLPGTRQGHISHTSDPVLLSGMWHGNTGH